MARSTCEEMLEMYQGGSLGENNMGGSLRKNDLGGSLGENVLNIRCQKREGHRGQCLFDFRGGKDYTSYTVRWWPNDTLQK